MSKPDLIELSTDWDTALRVADRYTGLGGERADDQNFLEQGARLLAAILVIANQEGKSYRWVGDLLEDSDHADMKAIIEEPSADPEVPLSICEKSCRRTCRLVAGSSLLPTAYSRRLFSPARFLIPTSTRTEHSTGRTVARPEKFEKLLLALVG